MADCPLEIRQFIFNYFEVAAPAYGLVFFAKIEISAGRSFFCPTNFRGIFNFGISRFWLVLAEFSLERFPMVKKLLLLSFILLLTAPLFAQKRSSKAKIVRPRSSVSAKTQANITASRKFRLNQRQGTKRSIVVLKNSQNLLPLLRLDTLKILVVSVGLGEESPLPQMMGRYLQSDHLVLDPKENPESMSKKLSTANNYNLVVVAMGDKNGSGQAGKATSDGPDGIFSDVEAKALAQEEQLILGQIAPETKMVWLFFGLHRFLENWPVTERCAALVVAGRCDFDSVDLTAQLLFGGIPATGKLPQTLSKFTEGEGIILPALNRLSYILPEEVGIDSLRLAQKMDSLIAVGLKEKAFPGCQLLLAKNGCVFYQRSYGYHTYDQNLPVRMDDLYDLASVTKVLAPVPALMMLADQNKFVVTKKMSEYWPDWKGSNKEGILVADLLSHQARLRSGVTLWPHTLDEHGAFRPEYFAFQPTPGYGLRVSEGLYLVDSYPDTVYKAIKDSPLLKSKKYAYSDLGFVILPRIIENLSGENFEKFLHNRLFAKLGASSLMYHPALAVAKDKIVPTENDRSFRQELLQGYVHDETAALLGGISGNAGLFGNAGDVAKVMQLYLQNGEYGNERFITSETVKNWTSSHFRKTNNRRGFGFDKPGIQTSIHTGKERYPSTVVSEQSYGHSGYTGTFVWADPVNQLLFVFLSNRVNPSRDNHRINKLWLRPKLLEALYIESGEPVKGR